jgi:hypothetical protein
MLKAYDGLVGTKRVFPETLEAEEWYRNRGYRTDSSDENGVYLAKKAR